MMPEVLTHFQVFFCSNFQPGQTAFSQPKLGKVSVRAFYIGKSLRRNKHEPESIGHNGETMKHACETLDRLDIPYEKKVVSAHRTPDLMFDYADSARNRGIKVIIAGAGGAAHLPGMVAAKTTLPVIGIPVQSKALNGLDSLLSIVQMPAGVPVATVAIGKAGATNAGLLAAQILSITDLELAERLERMRQEAKVAAIESSDELV
ncbi:5-(carboxyamino)imidazole ribonucleotide mutase [Neobacillus pocheonensis]|uniref:N5-carboxyaminoimidazole ribonucleotide mutase n=1 Tax=Neobacillus pocheonensis TaxID=363869 RepID=A0ABT0WIK2_9BACI|nr:5-(carboxyamino)imidazole ribonucleotide mutase [Neobacillus pocheonensis]